MLAVADQLRGYRVEGVSGFGVQDSGLGWGFFPSYLARTMLRVEGLKVYGRV